MTVNDGVDDAGTSVGTSAAEPASTGRGTEGSSSAGGPSSSTTTPDASGSGSESESTGATLHPCGLADLAPSASDPLVSGSEPMQIPPDIAAIQLGNCGCHLADPLEVDAPDYPATGPFDMTTWAGFQAIRASDGTPYHAIALDHVTTGFMPLSSYCDVGGGEAMPPDQRATLVEWLGMGAPDGATWIP